MGPLVDGLRFTLLSVSDHTAGLNTQCRLFLDSVSIMWICLLLFTVITALELLLKSETFSTLFY